MKTESKITAAAEIDTVTIAAGLVSSLRDPLKSAPMVRDLNKLLLPTGLCVVHHLLDANDLAVRASVPVSVAKKIVNNHGDVQVGRRWRMTEGCYAECVRLGRFKTSK